MTAENSYLGRLILSVDGLIRLALPLTAALALLVFLWGLAQFIFEGGSEKSIESGRNRMVWGVIALFVIFSVWGIVSLLRITFGLDPYTVDPGLQKPIPSQHCVFDSTLQRNICTTF
ncbi:MAG: protein of unknown function with transrane region [Parcubacteria group bacterium]|nr:protein of unknown function with transrane region [Parcubacteria group bacterium]